MPMLALLSTFVYLWGKFEYARELVSPPEIELGSYRDGNYFD